MLRFFELINFVSLEVHESMPIYEYVCENCGSQIEVMQKLGEAPLKRCGKCRGKLEKILSRTSFQLKGSGWYVSDYSRKSETGKADGESPKKSDAKSTSEVTCGTGPCSACE
jgi:putative FmdB family regulatory protein